MRFAVLLWFPGCCVNGPVAWLLKWTGSPTPSLRLKEVVPLRITGMYFQSCCVCPCHATDTSGTFSLLERYSLFAEDFAVGKFCWIWELLDTACWVEMGHTDWQTLFCPFFFFSCYEIFFLVTKEPRTIIAKSVTDVQFLYCWFFIIIGL